MVYACGCNPHHIGSSPVLASNNGLLAHLVEHLLCTQGVRGSNPRWSTNHKDDDMEKMINGDGGSACISEGFGGLLVSEGWGGNSIEGVRDIRQEGDSGLG